MSRSSSTTPATCHTNDLGDLETSWLGNKLTLNPGECCMVHKFADNVTFLVCFFVFLITLCYKLITTNPMRPLRLKRANEDWQQQTNSHSECVNWLFIITTNVAQLDYISTEPPHQQSQNCQAKHMLQIHVQQYRLNYPCRPVAPPKVCEPT